MSTTDAAVDAATDGTPGADGALADGAPTDARLDAIDEDATPPDGGEPVCSDRVVTPPEVCDDGNTDNYDGCNPTCDFAGETTLLSGAPMMPGFVDGAGSVARFGGQVVFANIGDEIWIGDASGRTVRRLDVPTGSVETIAGMLGVSGNVDAPIGTDARFDDITSMTSDGATVWVTDSDNRTLRAINVDPPHGVTTVAGGGSGPLRDDIGTAAVLQMPRGASYHAGAVYFIEQDAYVVRRFDVVTGEVNTVAGAPGMRGRVDGCGAEARIHGARYMIPDGLGLFYISDSSGNQIRIFESETSCITTLAGAGMLGHVDGIGIDAEIGFPRGLALAHDSLYVTDSSFHVIRQIELGTARVTTLLGDPCGGVAPCAGGYAEGVAGSALTGSPYDIVFDPTTGLLLFYDDDADVIRSIR